MRGKELAQFVAQCAHETANFSSLKELGGRLDFKKYDPKHNPRKAKMLGNKQVGDGARYHGRGYIQLTGRDNYKRAGLALGLPLEEQPELVERPDIAAQVAVWFWKNQVAPKVSNFNDTAQVTKPINSGLKGLEDRHNKFASIMALMGSKS
jgi:predicted chitinase